MWLWHVLNSKHLYEQKREILSSVERLLLWWITMWLRLEGISGGCQVQPACSSRVILEHLAQVCVVTASEYLQGWRLHHLPEQPQSVPGHSQREKMFLHVQRELLVFQSVPITLVLSLGTTERAWLSLPSLQVFILVDEISLNLLISSYQSQLSQPLLIEESALVFFLYLSGQSLSSLQ